MFDGVYIDGIKAFEGDEGNFFRYSALSHNTGKPETILDSSVDRVEVLTDDAQTKRIKVSNGAAYMILTASADSFFIAREIGLTTPVENEFSDYQVAFTLRSTLGTFDTEQGAFATKDTNETQSPVPYAFPAMYTQLHGVTLNANFVNVVDYVNTSAECRNFRKRKVREVFELGVCSSQAKLAAGQEVKLYDRFYINGRSGEDFYSLIGRAADEYLAVNPIPVDTLAAEGNRPAGSFAQLAEGLYRDVTDSRAGMDRFLGVMTAYGYNEEADGGWGESFALLDVMKGLVRYSKYTKDGTIMQTALNMTKVLVEPQNGKNWIAPYEGENAKADEYFLRHTYAGGFGVNSSGEETGSTPGISTWKYYDMLANLAEVALYSQSSELKAGFLKLMPFFNTLKLDGYVQPVAWYYQNRQPATGYENGGSGGAATMWGYIHLLASQMTDDASLAAKYRADGLASLQHANTLGYFQMHAMRVATKPVAIGWQVKTNVLAYDMTGEQQYLNRAKHVVKSITSFYYLNSNPTTFFASYGFGYADLRERWEAYFEMATSLWLVSDVMAYMADDTTLLDVYYSASRTHQWAFPINGDPHGNYLRDYDALDGYYIPFEFTTGVVSDNPGGEGGSQTNLRQIKEIYGSGETFLEFLMYEAWGESVSKDILTLCLTGASTSFSDTNHTFIVYNPANASKQPVVRFKNFADGNYRVTADGETMGTYSAKALEQGIRFALDGRQSKLVKVERTGNAADASAAAAPSLSAAKITSSSAELTVSGDWSHSKLEYSKYATFPAAGTQTLFSLATVTTLHFNDGETLYVRAFGIKADGVTSAASNVLRIDAPALKIYAADDFSADSNLQGWTVTGGSGKGDYHSAIFQGSQGTSSALTAQKTFTVDTVAARLLEMRFITKNSESLLKVYLTYADKRVQLFGDMSVVPQGVLRASLADTGLQIPKATSVSLTVTIELSGINRGFCLDFVRFGTESEHKAVKAFTDNTFTNRYNEVQKTDGMITLMNDAEPESVSSPSVDATFDPKAMPVFEAQFSGYRAIDTVTILIKDSIGTVVGEIRNSNLTNVGGKISRNLIDDFGIIEEGQYNFSYEVSNERVEVVKMQLVGASNKTEAVTRANGFRDGASAYLNDNDEIRLKTGVIYSYGDIRKTITVNMSETPIVFFDVAALSGNWAVKVVPEGGTADIRLTPDSAETGEHAYDLRSVIDTDGETQITFVLFVIGGSAADQSCYVKMNPIRFGDSISLVAEKNDEVIGELSYEAGNVNLYDTGYVTIDVRSLSENARWKVYIIDNATGRTTELKTVLERRYNKRYCREKIGRYVYDVKEIVRLTGEQNLCVKFVLIGNAATCSVADIRFVSSDGIPA